MFLDNILNSTNQFYSNELLVLLLLIFLSIATYTDIKELKIPNKLNLGFFILRLVIIPLVGLSIQNFIGGFLGFLFLLIPAMITMHKMGGDIKCIGVVGFYLGGYTTGLFIAVSCIYTITYFIYKIAVKKQIGNFPFAPFFLASHISLFIVSFLIR